jgi:hypothetical protein
VFETAKIDVPTDPSQVLDYRTVALQCPKNPRATWAVTREVSGKPLTYAEFADLCNAQIYPTAHLMRLGQRFEAARRLSAIGS